MTTTVLTDADTDWTAEAELVARLQAGDEEAYEALFRARAGAMLAVARKFFGDSDDAADAVQDAFVSAFRAMPGFAGTAKLATWLHRITVNACLMKIRASKRSRQVLMDTHGLAGREADSLNTSGRGTVPPDEALSRAETVAQVRDCIRQLPGDYQAVIRLRDLEELDTDATAARLGTNSGVVKTRLHRARHALRTLLEPAFTEIA